MYISLPQQAQDHFNKEADKFLLLLKPEPKKEDKRTAPLSLSHRPTQNIPDEFIIEFGIFGTIDGFGNQKSKYFHTDKGYVGLDEIDYAPLEHLAFQISDHNQVRQYLTKQYVIDTMFKWFENRYKGLIAQTTTFLDFLSMKAEADIKTYKIGIPLSFLAIQESFSLCNVVFDFYTKEYFDNLEKLISIKNPTTAHEQTDKLRNEYQGVVLANVTICGVQEKCLQMAVQETEKALLMLRFFSPTAFIPQIPSYFGRMGHVNLPIGHYFVTENDSPPITIKQNEEKKEYQYKLRTEDLAFLKTSGLDVLNELLKQNTYTDFEKLLLNSISLFTHGIVSSDYHDKIVFCLASIETLLLQNTTEPIQYSIGLRLAFITTNIYTERKKIIALVKDAYRIRSSYLHHGKREESMETLTLLQHTIISAFKNVMSNRTKFLNQAQMIEYIENMILS